MDPSISVIFSDGVVYAKREKKGAGGNFLSSAGGDTF